MMSAITEGSPQISSPKKYASPRLTRTVGITLALAAILLFLRLSLILHLEPSSYGRFYKVEEASTPGSTALAPSSSPPPPPPPPPPRVPPPPPVPLPPGASNPAACALVNGSAGAGGGAGGGAGKAYCTANIPALRRCLAGVVTVVRGGRFGNMFMEMASAWAVARTHGLPLATPRNLRKGIEPAFARAPLGCSLADLLGACGGGGGGGGGGKGFAACEAEALRSQLTPSEVPAAVRALSEQAAVQPIVIRMYAVMPEYIVPLLDELRAQVEWRPELREAAQKKLRDCARAAAQGTPLHNVVFVGVHVRRTDYDRWLSKNSPVAERAGPDYYLRALTFLAEQLQQDGAAGEGRPLAVVIASDDMKWVRAQLLPKLVFDERLPRVAVFAAGEGTEKSALRDMALLAACNHSVIAYGTYGMTVALLAGGRTVAFRLHDSYSSSRFARLLPNMTLMR